MLDMDFSKGPDNFTRPQEGFDKITPGRGMVLITAFNEYAGAKGKAHELELEIVAWTDPKCVAMTHRENIFFADNSGKGHPVKRLICLSMAAGLFNASDAQRWKEQNASPQFDMTKIIGSPIMIELVDEPDQNNPTRVYTKIGGIGLAFYHMKDPRVKTWPINQSVFNRMAASVGEWITDLPAVARKEETDPFAGIN